MTVVSASTRSLQSGKTVILQLNFVGYLSIDISDSVLQTSMKDLSEANCSRLIACHVSLKVPLHKRVRLKERHTGA